MKLTLKQATMLVLLATLITLPLDKAEKTINTAYQTVKATNAELLCLAKNIYYEARGESAQGKIAVAQVTLNRVTHRTEFEASICGVVYAKHQFSWTMAPHREPRGPAWLEAKAIAKAVVIGTAHLPGFKALYFHNLTVKPRWSSTKELVGRIGNHIFYN
jgi:spore germination cell wall hydrolase CwlJ-like protein